MNCGVICRCGLDLALLWLWCRPVATDPIWPLAWELPYASAVLLKRPKKKKKKKKERKKPLFRVPQSLGDGRREGTEKKERVKARTSLSSSPNVAYTSGPVLADSPQKCAGWVSFYSFTREDICALKRLSNLLRFHKQEAEFNPGPWSHELWG